MVDEDRFAAFYRRRYRAIHAYGVRRVGPEAAPDLAAEVFLIAWRRRIHLPEPDELPWLYTTARKVAANQLRSRNRRTALLQRVASVLATGVAEQLDPMDAVGAGVDVRAALARLAPKDQEALLLVEWEGLDQATAAEVVGCRVGTFKVRLHRARNRLAEAFGELHPPLIRSTS
jgi:RNA polymerase sigma-70 factor (ECF subfamily)